METGLPKSVPPTATCGLSSSRPPGRCSTAATSSVIPYAPRGMPAAIDLPTVTKSGASPHRRVSPPGPTTCVWVSSYASRVPVRRVTSRRPLVEAVVRQQEAHVVGEYRLGDHHRHLAPGQRALQGLEVVERYDERAGGDVVRQAGLLGHQPAVLELDQYVVEVAVVLAVEEQHLLATGRGPSDPDHLGVGARRRQRELPQRQAVATCQLARDPDRVLGRQQVLRPAARPAGSPPRPPGPGRSR